MPVVQRPPSAFSTKYSRATRGDDMVSLKGLGEEGRGEGEELVCVVEGGSDCQNRLASSTRPL